MVKKVTTWSNQGKYIIIEANPLRYAAVILELIITIINIRYIYNTLLSFLSLEVKGIPP